MSQGRDQPERFGTRLPTPCRCSGMEWAWGQTHQQPSGGLACAGESPSALGLCPLYVGWGW